MSVHGIILQVHKGRAVFRDVIEADTEYIVDYSPNSKLIYAKKVDGALLSHCRHHRDITRKHCVRIGNVDAQLDK